MSDYTPTTEEVRQGWRTVKDGKFYVKELPIESDEFDRWLAEVKAQVWDKGYEAGLTDFASSMTTNPYRQGETE